MRLIDANKLCISVERSMHDNQHTDGKVKANHNHEHLHFLNLIRREEIVDAKPVVHAKWNEDELGYICSFCGGKYITNIAMSVHKFVFCPYCGATMDRKEDSND